MLCIALRFFCKEAGVHNTANIPKIREKLSPIVGSHYTPKIQ